MSEDLSTYPAQSPGGGNLHVTVRERTSAVGSATVAVERRGMPSLGPAPAEQVTLQERASAAASAAVADRRGTPSLGSAPTELVLFAAFSPRELLAKAELVDSSLPVAELARAGQLRLKAGPAPAGPVRLAVTATDTAELIAKLDAAAGRITGDPRSGFLHPPTGIHYATGMSRAGNARVRIPGARLAVPRDGRRPGDVPAIGPGALQRHAAAPANGGEALHRIVFPPPALTEIERAAQESRLAAPEWAQAALAVHSLTLVQALQDLGVQPGCVGGQGFGGLVAHARSRCLREWQGLLTTSA